jgi:hypothetical protein
MPLESLSQYNRDFKNSSDALNRDDLGAPVAGVRSDMQQYAAIRSALPTPYANRNARREQPPCGMHVDTYGTWGRHGSRGIATEPTEMPREV